MSYQQLYLDRPWYGTTGGNPWPNEDDKSWGVVNACFTPNDITDLGESGKYTSEYGGHVLPLADGKKNPASTHGYDWRGDSNFPSTRYSLFAPAGTLGNKKDVSASDKKLLARSYIVNGAKGFYNASTAKKNPRGYGYRCLANANEGYGYPGPVGGITIDFHFAKDFSDSKDKFNDYYDYLNKTKDDNKTLDWQINYFYLIFRSRDPSLGWVSMEVMPNGDNWGAENNSHSTNTKLINVKNNKYIFRRSTEWLDSDDLPTMIVSKNSYWYKHVDEYGWSKSAKLTLLKPFRDSAPKNCVFAGFEYSIWIGNQASVDACKRYWGIHNINVIDEYTAKQMADPNRPNPTVPADHASYDTNYRTVRYALEPLGGGTLVQRRCLPVDSKRMGNLPNNGYL